MSNQSSVEWLYQEFERIDKEFHVGSHEYNYAKNLAFKISKAMHKEEILEAYKTGWEECINSKYLPATYYEKTYNNQQ